MNEYFEEDLDYSLEDIREDFEYIWKKNILQSDLIREQNPQAGDYFATESDESRYSRKLWINVQGISSDNYKTAEQGLITPDAHLHGYVKWDEDIENLDIIKIDNWYYRIQNYNKSMYAGQFVFQEFDLYRIDRVVN